MATENVEAEGEDHDHDGPITHDPSVRAKWLSTIVAIPIAFHYPAIIVAAVMGLVDLEAVTQSWFLFDTVGWLGVMTYIFGERTIAAARQAMGKD